MQSCMPSSMPLVVPTNRSCITLHLQCDGNCRVWVLRGLHHSLASLADQFLVQSLSWPRLAASWLHKDIQDGSGWKGCGMRRRGIIVEKNKTCCEQGYSKYSHPLLFPALFSWGFHSCSDGYGGIVEITTMALNMHMDGDKF